MKIKTVNLETVCGITSTLPVNTQAEFAFAGKSNVGKSSLINGLMNRKSYARVSGEPGKTQTINFYRIDAAEPPASFYLVDLPGYGYARVSQKEREKWGKMVERYLHTSRQLRLIFLLIDMRHEPSANDLQMQEWVKYQGFTPVIIATKSDKIKKSAKQRQISMLRKSLKLAPEDILIPYSSLTKEGREEVYAVIASHLTDVS